MDRHVLLVLFLAASRLTVSWETNSSMERVIVLQQSAKTPGYRFAFAVQWSFGQRDGKKFEGVNKRALS